MLSTLMASARGMLLQHCPSSSEMCTSAVGDCTAPGQLEYWLACLQKEPQVLPAASTAEKHRAAASRCKATQASSTGQVEDTHVDKAAHLDTVQSKSAHNLGHIA